MACRPPRAPGAMLGLLPLDRGPRDAERPFKAYPRSPSSLAGSAYYGALAMPSYGDGGGSAAGPPPAHLGGRPMADGAMDMRPLHPYDLALMGDPPVHGRGGGGGGGGYKLEALAGMQHYGGPYTHQHHPAAAYASCASLHPSAAPSLHPSASDMPPMTLMSTVRDMAGGGSPKAPSKKRALAVPDEMKDTGYWDKRLKNNDSAKRSRESRRFKEEQIAMRVVYLEQDNLQLRTEVSLLKRDIEKLRCMLYNS